MTYKDFIQHIIDVRGRNGCTGYYESHHIIPRCMGGTNDAHNLVDLYAQEHYDAHKLLALENPENDSLWNAWSMMAFPKGDTCRENIIISKTDYALLRESNSKMMSKRMKGKEPINKGLHYYNNGIKTIAASECPTGFKKGILISDASKERLANSKGKHYYNNGIIEVREFNCPDGFICGRLPGKYKRKKFDNCHRKWYNDGVNEYYRKECPYNCVEGRLLKSSSTSGYHWYNNGIKQLTATSCPIGFIKGRLSKGEIKYG